MDTYALVLDEVAVKAIVMAARAEQRRLATILDQVKTAPFRAGDYQQRDKTGRMNEVVLFDDWLVTFWSDHAVREIRIVNLEQVRGGSTDG